MYLDINLYHFQNIMKAIPYKLGIREKRICTEEADYKVQHHEMYK